MPDSDQQPFLDTFIEPEGIHVIIYKHNESNDSPLIVFCHGSTGNNSMRRYAYDASRLLGINILLWDYPGFGNSKTKGLPDHNKNYKSSMRVMDFVINELMIDESNICLWGESVGGVFAAFLASAYPGVKCLVLWSAFSSLTDMLKDHGARMMCGIRRRAGLEDLKTKDYLEEVVCPILFVHSQTDQIVPFGNCERNIKHALRNQTKDRMIFYEIEGGHAQPLLKFDDLVYIKDFILMVDEGAFE